VEARTKPYFCTSGSVVNCTEPRMHGIFANEVEADGSSARKTHQASNLLLRNAVASLALTLIFVPGGFRALMHNGMGWEAWSFSRFLILPVIVLHLATCWWPLALRYFKRGECREVFAFVIATCTLLLQMLICYGLFENYALWQLGG
jgi:hypothetical protein